MKAIKIHKYIKILKIDGILLLLLDLVILLNATIGGDGLIGTMPLFSSVILEVLILQFIDLFWVIDSYNWVKKEQRKFINIYFGIKIFLLVITYVCMYTNNINLVIIMLYLVSSYYTIGVIAIIKCIKNRKD